MTIMSKWLLAAAACALLSACGGEGRDSRWLGDIADPYCMPDGSTVMVQYSNSTGGFEPSQGEQGKLPLVQGLDPGSGAGTPLLSIT